MINCSYCNSSGWVTATSRDLGYIYAFRCTCDIPRRKQLSERIPLWTERFRGEFSTEFSDSLIGAKPKEPLPNMQPKQDYKILASDPHFYDDDDAPF